MSIEHDAKYRMIIGIHVMNFLYQTHSQHHITSMKYGCDMVNSQYDICTYMDFFTNQKYKKTEHYHSYYGEVMWLDIWGWHNMVCSLQENVDIH